MSKPDARLFGAKPVFLKRSTTYADGLKNSAMGGAGSNRPTFVGIILTIEGMRLGWRLESRAEVDQICAELESLRDIVWPPN